MKRLIYTILILFSLNSAAQNSYVGTWSGSGQVSLENPGQLPEISDCQELFMTVDQTADLLKIHSAGRVCDGKSEVLYLPEVTMTKKTGHWRSADPDENWSLDGDPSSESFRLSRTSSDWTDELTFEKVTGVDSLRYQWMMTKAGASWRNYTRGQLKRLHRPK